MNAQSAALKKRWADPAYRTRQTEANRRAARERRAYFADPLHRKQHALAITNSRRNRGTR